MALVEYTAKEKDSKESRHLKLTKAQNAGKRRNKQRVKYTIDTPVKKNIERYKAILTFLLKIPASVCIEDIFIVTPIRHIIVKFILLYLYIIL